MSNPLSDLIQRGESGSTSYNAYNRGTQGGRILGPDHSIDFSKLTVGQVQDMQNKGEMFAVGKYQVIPSTMNGAIASLNLDPNQAFTPELQEKIFSDYLIGDQRPAIRGYIIGKSNDLDGAQLAVAQQWRSVADPRTGESYVSSHHKGSNPNHASITADEVAGALNTMRAEYQADIAKDMKPDEAWNAVTHSMASHEQAASTHATHPHAAHNHPVPHQGAHGPAVHDLQTQLAGLGYLNAKGIDGDFGIRTRHAVERFQHDHHLTVDGKVGPLTQQALHAARREHATTHDLTNPRNPDHALFEQAIIGVRTLDAKHDHISDQHSLNLAAALTVEAKREGLTRIDQVALSEDASRTIAIQLPSLPTEIVPRYAGVVTMTGLQTSLAESAARAAAVPPPVEPVAQIHIQPHAQTHALPM